MENIEKMSDWSILVYLRQERNWMVQAHFDRKDISSLYDTPFADDLEWQHFCNFACKAFDDYKDEIMSEITDMWRSESNN